jgi:hypothetical protein
MKVSYVSYNLPLSHLVLEQGLADSQQLPSLNSTQRTQGIFDNVRKPATSARIPSWRVTDNRSDVPRRELHDTEFGQDEDDFSTGTSMQQTYSKPTSIRTRAPAKTAHTRPTLSGSQKTSPPTQNYQKYTNYHPKSGVAGHVGSSDSTPTRVPSSAGSATHEKAPVKVEASASQRDLRQGRQRSPDRRQTTYNSIDDPSHWINHGRDDPVPSVEDAHARDARAIKRARRPY